MVGIMGFKTCSWTSRAWPCRMGSHRARRDFGRRSTKSSRLQSVLLGAELDWATLASSKRELERPCLARVVFPPPVILGHSAMSSVIHSVSASLPVQFAMLHGTELCKAGWWA